MIKTLNKVGIKGMYLDIIKAINDKPKLTLSSMVRNGKLFLEDQKQDKLLLFNIVLGLLARTIRQEKRTERHPNQDRRSKTVSICR